MEMLRRPRLWLLIGTLLILFLSLCCSSTLATTSYRGREEGAQWRSKALDRIERIRKADLVVEVVNREGQPVPGAQVKVAMQRHSFAFGSAVTAQELTAATTDGDRYRGIVEMNFNKVVFENDLKWEPWEISKDYPTSRYSMQKTDAALRWLKERGIAVRGHCLVWAHLEGERGTIRRKILPREEFAGSVLAHAEDEVRVIGGRVGEWDVVNHPIGWGKGTMGELFGSEFYDSVFQKVAEWNPQAKRYINEGDVLPHKGANRERYFQLLSEMRGRGAKMDGIGFMGHFKGEHDLAPPEELLATFDKFAALGLPLQVTEFDVRFGPQMDKPYPLTVQQEALQADYLRDFLIAAFSHEKMEGVVIWGFWEGRDWYPDAALYRKDWSIKPNGKAWQDLVLRQWWTNVAGESDRGGHFSTRGFLGDYVVEVEAAGRKPVVTRLQLERPGKTLKVVLQ
jgi:endo-1,4-beta-xylanase